MRFNNSRGFGVEIEIRSHQVRSDGDAYHVSTAQVARWLRNAGLDARNERYNHETRTWWKVTTDASCGLEVVSPILYGEEGLEQVRKVVRKLKAHGAVVDDLTGLHVHHDATDFTGKGLKQVLAMYGQWQESINELMAVTRRNNYFCQPISRVRALSLIDATPDTWSVDQQARSLSHGGRYQALNLQAYAVHNTVEFRQHHGTLDAERVVSWVVVTQLMMERARTTTFKAQPLPAAAQNERKVGRFGMFLRHGGSGELEQYAIKYLAHTKNGRDLARA